MADEQLGRSFQAKGRFPLPPADARWNSGGMAKTTSPPEREPAIREISIEEAGGPQPLDAPPPRPWVIAIVVGAAAVGLGYGLLLGRGDRPRPDVPPTPDSTIATATTSTSVPPFASPELFQEGRVSFVRGSTGHMLGPGVTEYLNAGYFAAVAVDAHGIIWAGGSSGVVRLDPTTGLFVKLTASDGTGPRDVTEIAVGPDGTVWAASSRGLSHWDGAAWGHESRFNSSYPSQRWVSGLDVGPQGEVWLATNSWDDGGWTSTAQIHRLEEPYFGEMWSVTASSEVGGMRVGDDGTLWVIVRNQLWSFDGTWHMVIGLGAGWYHTLAIDAVGGLWIGGENQIARWDGEALTRVEWGAPPNTDPLEVEVWVEGLARGAGEDVWAVVNGWDPETDANTSELVHFESGTSTSIPLPLGSEVGYYGPPAVAPDGAVWVLTETGLLRFDGEWHSFVMENELPFNSVNGLAVASTGELWVAADDAIVLKDGDRWHRFGVSEFGLGRENESGWFWVAAGPDGSIWGGVGCHAYRRVEGAWLPLPVPAGVPDECFDTFAMIDPGGSLWMKPTSWYQTPVYRWSGEWEQVAVAGYFLDAAVSEAGTVWLVDDRGIKRSVGDEWETVLAGVPVAEIAISGDGEIWAAGAGWPDIPRLWNYDGVTWTLTGEGEAIHSLTEGPDGSVWALEDWSEERTSLVNVTTGRTRFIADSPVYAHLAIAPDGTIWLGGDGRLYRVDPLD
jgi:hypothetical protein